MLLNTNGFPDIKEKIEDNNSSKSKFVFYLIVILLTIASIFIFTSSSTVESEKEKIVKDDYKVKKLNYLKNKIKSTKLSYNEMKEFCKYAEEIENTIYIECHCDGENKFIDDSGINWLDPPQPEDLKNYDYVEIPKNVNDTSRRRIFINQYKQLRIGFDFDHPSGNKYEKAPPHYHRYYSFEETEEGKNKYLDECGELTRKGSKESHIYFKGSKIIKRLLK